MLLSIIVPVFNGGNKIERCLKSLIRIAEQEVEFIIVNDGSTDNTVEICEGYIKLDNRFCLINQANLGVSKARNKGLRFAKGEYIGFVDADDELTEEYEDVIEIIKNTKCDLYSFPHYVQFSTVLKTQERDLYIEGKNEKEILFNDYLMEKSNCVWNNIYRLSIIREYGIQFPEDMKMGEDCLFNGEYFQHCKYVYYVEKYGYKYYYDDYTSVSKAMKIEYLNDFVKIYDALDRFYQLFEHLGVKFEFGCPYYFGMVYEILCQNRKKLSPKMKKDLRESAFYRKIIGYQYSGKKNRLKKVLIRIWLS